MESKIWHKWTYLRNRNRFIDIENRLLVKKNEVGSLHRDVDGPRVYHTKWSKSKRERQIPYNITYMWNLKFDTNEHIYETETDSQI